MDNLERAGFLNDLAQLLREQFRRTDQLTFLDEAITLGREVLELRPSPHPDQSLSLINLAIDFWRHHDQTDQVVDLEEAIVLNREVLELGFVPHRHLLSILDLLKAPSLNKPASEFTCAHWSEMAIINSRDALELCCPFHADWPCLLIDCSQAIFGHFNHTQVADLEEAIVVGREALELCPLPHRHRASSLNNLAFQLSRSFDETNKVADLHEAMWLYHEGLELERASSPLRLAILKGLFNT
jgi:hypothetical protein